MQPATSAAPPRLELDITTLMPTATTSRANQSAGPCWCCPRYKRASSAPPAMRGATGSTTSQPSLKGTCIKGAATVSGGRRYFNVVAQERAGPPATTGSRPARRPDLAGPRLFVFREDPGRSRNHSARPGRSGSTASVSRSKYAVPHPHVQRSRTRMCGACRRHATLCTGSSFAKDCLQYDGYISGRCSRVAFITYPPDASTCGPTAQAGTPPRGRCARQAATQLGSHVGELGPVGPPGGIPRPSVFASFDRSVARGRPRKPAVQQSSSAVRNLAAVSSLPT